MNQVETEGLVLSVRPYKERDQLVKIFTEKYGKVMFLVKRAASPTYKHRSSIQLFSGATYIARISESGLSFINSTKGQFQFTNIQQDFEINAYGVYILNLVDLVLDDHLEDPLLYGFVKQALSLMNKKYDASVIAAIFAIQLLPRFGVRPTFNRCTLCSESRMDVPFDFCEQTGGVICYRHFETQPRRYHATPRAIYFLRQFQEVKLSTLESIELSYDTKQEIWDCIDHLYDSYVGIFPKSRQYIKKMQQATQALLSQRSVDKKT